jgi:hypothetical protein
MVTYRRHPERRNDLECSPDAARDPVPALREAFGMEVNTSVNEVINSATTIDPGLFSATTAASD